MHMHLLGQSGRIEVQRTNGDVECILDIPKYQFEWQRTYRLVEPVTVKRDDILHIECLFDNPNDYNVYWGDGTNDEMCLGTLFMTH